MKITGLETSTCSQNLVLFEGTVALELPQEIVEAETPGRLRWKRKRRLLKQSKNLTTGDGQNLIQPKDEVKTAQHRAR